MNEDELLRFAMTKEEYDALCMQSVKDFYEKKAKMLELIKEKIKS